MKLVSLHGDGSAHRQWLHVRSTPEPWAFVVPAGGLVLEASGRTWSSDYPVIALFWPQRYYQVFVLLKATTTEYYCNIIAPPQYEPRRSNSSKDMDDNSAVTFFDLDLDLYVKVTEGKIEVEQLDQAEFEQRQSGYSQEWISSALAGRDELLRLALTSTGPFAPATASWWRAYVKREG